MADEEEKERAEKLAAAKKRVSGKNFPDGSCVDRWPF